MRTRWCEAMRMRERLNIMGDGDERTYKGEMRHYRGLFATMTDDMAQEDCAAAFRLVMSRNTKIAPGEAGYPFVSYQ